MKVFFFLGQTFFDYSLSICDEIKERYPDAQFTGIVAARSNLLEQLEKSGTIDNYDWLSALEKQWLETPLDKQKLAKYEKQYGAATLRRIITADREIGVGFVSCGVVERTDLMLASLENEEAKWRYVVGLLDYFHEIFAVHKIQITFTYCIAGAVALAMALVAKEMGIKFVQPAYTRLDSKYVMNDSIITTLPRLKADYEQYLTNPQLLDDRFINEAEQFIEKFRSRPEVPSYTSAALYALVKNLSWSGFTKTVATDIARWGAIGLGLKGTKGVLRQRYGGDILKLSVRSFFGAKKLLRQHDSNIDELTTTQKYIYFPLHVDPEASTMVQADKITNQLTVIEAIAKNMPTDMILVVKEHFPCIGKRPKNFYKQIQNMPDVKLVSPFWDNFKLLKNSSLAATITGTVGWEALILQKPLLMFGHVDYINVDEGFVYCDNLYDLESLISQAIQAKPCCDEKLTTYIATLIKESINLSPNELWYGQQRLPEEKAIAIKAIVDKFEEILNYDTTKLAA